MRGYVIRNLIDHPISDPGRYVTELAVWFKAAGTTFICAPQAALLASTDEAQRNEHYTVVNAKADQRIREAALAAAGDPGVICMHRTAPPTGRFDARLLLPAHLSRLGEASTSVSRPSEVGAAAESATDVERGDNAAERGDRSAAQAAYLRADQRGHPTAAAKIGAFLEARGDVFGAIQAYRRADERGDALVAFKLGQIMARRNDPSGAAQAWRRADERGHAEAAFAIGSLLSQICDLNHDAAEAAYRRSLDRGHAPAAANLGFRLERRGDLAAAEAAYRCGDKLGDEQAAFNLGMLKARRGDLVGAESDWRRADARGDAEAAFTVGALLAKRGRRRGRRDSLHARLGT